MNMKAELYKFIRKNDRFYPNKTETTLVDFRPFICPKSICYRVIGFQCVVFGLSDLWDKI
jgi:hypothetical protein